MASAALKFEKTLYIKEFCEVTGRTERWVRYAIGNLGLPAYREGVKLTFKLSDYEQWREQRRILNK